MGVVLRVGGAWFASSVGLGCAGNELCVCASYAHSIIYYVLYIIYMYAHSYIYTPLGSLHDLWEPDPLGLMTITR